MGQYPSNHAPVSMILRNSGYLTEWSTIWSKVIPIISKLPLLDRESDFLLLNEEGIFVFFLIYRHVRWLCKMVLFPMDILIMTRMWQNQQQMETFAMGMWLWMEYNTWQTLKSDWDKQAKKVRRTYQLILFQMQVILWNACSWFSFSRFLMMWLKQS